MRAPRPPASSTIRVQTWALSARRAPPAITSEPLAAPAPYAGPCAASRRGRAAIHARLCMQNLHGGRAAAAVETKRDDTVPWPGPVEWLENSQGDTAHAPAPAQHLRP